MKKNLLLVQPIASYTNAQPVLPQDAVGIGMLTILAYVSKFGYSGEVVHLPIAFASGYHMDDILRHIKDTDPDVIGFIKIPTVTPGPIPGQGYDRRRRYRNV